MALQKEIWLSTIINGLFASNSFMAHAVNLDGFVNGKRVHVPNAGYPSKTEKDRRTLPATIKTRTDVDLSFDLHEYTTDPIRIPHAETVELSYDKRESVLSGDRAALIDAVAKDMCHSWAATKAEQIISTSGTAVVSHLEGSTGKRKSLTSSDVLQLMTLFDKQDVPQEERYLLLDAVMYSQLLNNLTTQQTQAFLASADAQRGVLGNLWGFDVMKRSTVISYKGNTPHIIGVNPEGGDLAGAIAWQRNCVGRALGEVEMFEEEKSPTYYGDIYSFLVRAGGSPMRHDGKGVAAIVQAATA